MESKLKKLFIDTFRRFLIIIIPYIFVLSILSISSWFSYLNNDLSSTIEKINSLILVVASTIILLGHIIYLLPKLCAFIKDFKLVKQNSFNCFIGKIEDYEEYYLNLVEVLVKRRKPIIINVETGERTDLGVVPSEIEIGTYKFLYLKN